MSNQPFERGLEAGSSGYVEGFIRIENSDVAEKNGLIVHHEVDAAVTNRLSRLAVEHDRFPIQAA